METPFDRIVDRKTFGTATQRRLIVRQAAPSHKEKTRIRVDDLPLQCSIAWVLGIISGIRYVFWSRR
jgi:hypothetical protein